MSGAFDEAFVAEVRERNDIVSVVGDYVQLKKAGTSWKGLCPFHGEKTPSFHVHADRQFFYCFGCQTGGDVLTFVREMNGYSFPEAVRQLAERAGMAVPEPRAWQGGADVREGGSRPAKPVRDGYYTVGRVALEFYVATLDGADGGAARLYLEKRGVTRETATRFGLGCAPDRWDGLCVALQRQDVDLAVAEALGLVVKKQGGGYYDRFRNRLMFPIRNVAGEVLGFSGRTLDTTDPSVAKYVNSPDSPVYQKGDTLFGVFEGRPALRKAACAILVEGNLDLVSLSQAGLGHVIAPLGTALTAAQCRLLRRFVARVVALYDGDGAGREAARKAAQLALAEGLPIQIATLPDGEDPDSYVRKHGREALEALIERAVPGFEYLLDKAMHEARALDNARGAKAAVEALAGVLAEIADPSERALYERKVAETLGIDDKTVREIARGAGHRPRPRLLEAGQGAAAAEGPGGGSLEEAEDARTVPEREFRMIELLAVSVEARALYLAHDTADLIHHAGARAFANAIASVEVGTLGEVLGHLPVGAMRDRLLRRMAERAVVSEEAARGYYEQLVKTLKRDAIERKLDALKRDERRASLQRDEIGALEVMVARQKLMRERAEIDTQIEGLGVTRD